MSTIPTILIIDDDAAVADTFARMLRLAGYGVLTAGDGDAGLREIVERRPDAAVVDLRMPTVDGLTFVRRLRTLEKDNYTPIAIITGDYLLDETILAALSTLSTRVYFKPLWLDDLLSIAEQLLKDSKSTSRPAITLDSRYMSSTSRSLPRRPSGENGF